MIIITGSSGTIGTGLFRKLKNEGYSVIGVDKNPNRWDKDLNKKTILADLTKKAHISKLPKKDIRMVIHLAANVRVYHSVKKPILGYQNTLINYNILEYIRKNKIPQVIFASSREVYGSNKKAMKEEEVDIRKCESPYTASKISGEAFLHAYGHCYSITYAIIRYSNVYGKYDTHDRVVPLFLSRAIKNKPLYVFGKDKGYDFTYVDDAVDGSFKVVEKIEKINKETFNISTGIKTKIIDLAKKIKEMTQSKSKIIIKDNRIGEINSYVGDITKAKQLLNYTPKIGIDEGLRKAYEWYKSNGML